MLGGLHCKVHKEGRRTCVIKQKLGVCLYESSSYVNLK